MRNKSNSPYLSQSKDNQFIGQKQRVFEAFRRSPKTMLMVSVSTGILRANICRYVAEWRKENKIIIYRKADCYISKRKANHYTTNPEIIKHISNPFNPNRNG